LKRARRRWTPTQADGSDRPRSSADRSRHREGRINNQNNYLTHYRGATCSGPAPPWRPRSFVGNSVGRWIDTGHDGRHGLLEIETRQIKGPRSLGVGIPLHQDNMTVVKERLYLDPGNSDIMRDEVTTIDHAFTRP
jgi:hypothetical protein